MDGVAPVALPLWLVRRAGAEVLASPNTRTAAPLFFSGGDAQGEAWFYWWLHRAVTTGVPIDRPDVVCAPGGIGLGNNFGTRVDAWMAYPFFERWTFPESFNLAVLSIPVVNAWLAWLGLRLAGAAAPVAVLGGSVLGVSAYVLDEISEGRSANALVGFAVALVGSMVAVRRGRLAAVPVAAGAAALTVLAYPPFALLVAPVVGGLILSAGWAPAGERRWARIGVAIVSAVALATAWAYADALSAAGFSRTTPVDGQEWQRLARDSLPWSWPWLEAVRTGPLAFEAHETWFSPWLAAGAVAALGLAGRERRWSALGWIAAGVWSWFATLGAFVLTRSGDADVLVRHDGAPLALPLRYALDVAPTLTQIRPYRFAPFVAVCLVFTMTAASRRSAWRSALVAGVLGWALVQADRTGRLVVTWQPWKVPASVERVAAMPGRFAILELPAGGGHAFGAMQAYHQKDRSESHHDHDARIRAGGDAPRDCYTDPFARALWTLDQGKPAPDDLPALAQASAEAGFRYLVVYREAYAPPGRYDRTMAVLRTHLGRPTLEDRDGALFTLDGQGADADAASGLGPTLQ